MNFKTHLLSLGYSESCNYYYVHQASMIENWMKQKNILPASLCYNDLLTFVKEQNIGKRKRLHQCLSVLRHYCSYLIGTGQTSSSFTHEFYIKNITIQPPPELLTKEQLQFINEQYNSKGMIGKRNKVILNLLIHQGLCPAEISELTPAHIVFAKRKIHIPETRKTAARVLLLEKEQAKELEQYITIIRPMMLEIAGLQSDKLFACMGGSERIHNNTDKLIKQIKKYTPEVRGTVHIQMSVMNSWLQEYGFERLQQMAGRNYVMPPNYKND